MAIVQINIMKTKPLTFLLALTFLFLFSGCETIPKGKNVKENTTVVISGDLQDGEDAAKRGDYKTAYNLFLPLAKQGNA